LVVVEEGLVIEATKGFILWKMDGGSVDNKKMKVKVNKLKDGKFTCPTFFFLYLKWNGNGSRWVCELSPMDPISFIV